MSDIDRQMQQDGFWDNPAQNATIMQQRRALERRLQTLNRLRSDAEELAVWRELLEEGVADEDMDKFLDRLTADLTKLELELKLAGPDDDKKRQSWPFIPAPAAPSRRTGPRCCCACICAGPSSTATRSSCWSARTARRRESKKRHLAVRGENAYAI